MDNTTEIAYINHLGWTRSQSLAHCAGKLWQWCLQRGITLSAEHLTGTSNLIVDKSRTLHYSAKCKLHPVVYSCIFHSLDPCNVDLFASRLNSQLSQYISWRSDPFAIATDAFQSSWQQLQGYTLPPFALVGTCLQKIHQEGSSIILVAPVWPAQPWYPMLL